MHCIPGNNYFVISVRKFITLSMFVIFLFITNLSNGVAANTSIKHGHHGPLPLALNIRSVHESGSSANNNIGKTILGSRGTSESRQSSESAVSTAAVGEGGGGGEILLPKTFPLSAQEPTCEQLRAMWIFSKRQSRAAEITNEIPTYRDPFAYNVWEPFYSTTRSIGGVRMVPRFGDRSRSPVFGRVVSREPILPQRFNIGQRQRHMGGIALTGSDPSNLHLFGSESKPTSLSANGRRNFQYRYVGGNGSSGSASSNTGQPNSVAVQGSFQKLKELIWTERAKELTQQRRAEEMAARAAVLKELANGQNIHASYKSSPKSESFLMDENRSPDRDAYEHMSDDHRTGSIASGHSQVLGGTRDPKAQNKNTKNVGSTRSYSANTQKHSPKFEGYNGGRSGRHMLPRVIASSYSYDDTGVPKSFPMRPSHFRERNRSLFKQSSPNEYFQREQRQKNNGNQMNANAQNDMFFQRLINEINKRILEKQHQSEFIPNDDDDEVDQQEDNQNWLDERYPISYDDDEPPTKILSQDISLENSSDYF